VTEDVREFPPGTWYTASEGFHRYATVESGRLPEGDPDRIALELRHRLDQAVARCVVADEMGTWLSGGVDSSVIATVAWPRVRTLHSFVSGVKGAPDLAYGEQMATFLGTVHHSLLVTREDLAAALPEVIYHLESFDALLVRSSVVNYLTAQLASDYVSAVLSGEGGDELLVGYDYIKQVPPSAIPAEVEDIVMRLHNTALQRVDRCAYAHGLVPHIPFADMDVVRYALRIPAEHKIHRRGGTAIEKWILRRAFQGLLPDAVLWRPKAKFWQGAGVETLLAEHAEAFVTDADFRRERVLPNGWQLHSKEELVYYRFFREHFGEISNLDWMGRTKRVSGSPVTAATTRQRALRDSADPSSYEAPITPTAGASVPSSGTTKGEPGHWLHLLVHGGGGGLSRYRRREGIEPPPRLPARPSRCAWLPGPGSRWPAPAPPSRIP